MLDAFLPYRLFCAHKAVHKLIQVTYERSFGLTDLQWRIVAALSWGNPKMQRDLCIITDADKVAVNRAVQVLDSRGIVRRQYSDNDRRSHLLSLTEAGEALSDEIGRSALYISDALAGAGLPAEPSSLIEELRRLEDLANSLLARQPIGPEASASPEAGSSAAPA